jgi:hypothetical protein
LFNKLVRRQVAERAVRAALIKALNPLGLHTVSEALEAEVLA